MGYIPVVGASGPTAKRPVLGPADAGFMYFDTDLSMPIWWDGTGWVDGNGEEP